MSAFFEHQCGLLTILKSETTPNISFIDDPRVGVNDLNLLPFSLFPQLENEPLTVGFTTTYQDKINGGTLIVKRLKSNSISIAEPEGMGQQLVEVVRADFNGDGTEAILLFEYCYATHGSLGFGGIKLITRKQHDALFEVITPSCEIN